tara:strand:+ start:974 stop:1807 length:834 start_codon:yes stop_codon:yes gene_type:complete
LHKIIYASGLTGFIGRNLLPILLESYDDVINLGKNNKAIIYRKDHTEQTQISKSLFSKYPSNTFINLATLYDPSPNSISNFNDLIEANINFPLNIIENFLMKTNDDLNIVNTSSYMQLIPLKFQNQYSLSKEIFLNRLKSKTKNIKNLYLFDSFGKGDTRNKVTDIFIKNIINNKEIKIPSNDIHINLSNVDGICSCIKESIFINQGDYSILSPNTLTLEDLAKKLMKIIGKQVNIIKLNFSHDMFKKVTYLPMNIYPKLPLETFELDLQKRIDEIK